ncbi:HTH_48 domain-containing protein [Trichonephila clavipes]|nr:HTH_48 domain-containing protein [Trichonephila clavipes]
MCTNCSSEPATPAHILECLGFTKQDLADVHLLMLDFLKVEGKKVSKATKALKVRRLPAPLKTLKWFLLRYTRAESVVPITESVGISETTCRRILTENLHMHRVVQRIVPTGFQEAYGESVLPCRTVERWVKEFNEGRQNVADMHRLGYPSVSEAEVRALTTRTVIDAKRFVPHHVTEMQKWIRYNAARTHMDSYKNEEDTFFRWMRLGPDGISMNGNANQTNVVITVTTTFKISSKPRQCGSYGDTSVRL